MRYDDIWIAGTGVYEGRSLPADTAVMSGRLQPHLAAGIAAVSVSVADLAPPEMALVAGRDAVARAREAGARVTGDSAFIHSYTNFQGIELWPAECWLAGQLVGENLTTLPISITAGSNGSLASLEHGACALTSRVDVPSVVITVADRYPDPWDRWNLSPGMLFGDGAASAVVARGAGNYRLESMATRTDTSLEGLARGAEQFSVAPVGKPDSNQRAREFLAEGRVSLRDVRTRSATGVREVALQALSEADLSIDQIDWCLPPFVGKTLFEQGFMRPLGYPSCATLLDLGLTTGHMGPVDGLYALNFLLEQDLCHPGQKVLVIGTGMGFTFSAAVLTVANTPFRTGQ